MDAASRNSTGINTTQNFFYSSEERENRREDLLKTYLRRNAAGSSSVGAAAVTECFNVPRDKAKASFLWLFNLLFDLGFCPRPFPNRCLIAHVVIIL